MQDSSLEIEPIWCVVANIRDGTVAGAYQEQESQAHFSPGTKVYCFPRQWCPSYGRLHVLAHHRGSSRLIVMVISVKFLTNVRVKKVYKPQVIEAMKGHWDASEECRQRADELAQSLRVEIGESRSSLS